MTLRGCGPVGTLASYGCLAGGRVLAGVSAGVARRYDLNSLVARLLSIAVAVVLTPLVYAAAWILMPDDAAAQGETG